MNTFALLLLFGLGVLIAKSVITFVKFNKALNKLSVEDLEKLDSLPASKLSKLVK